jgi:hypothetical protein
MSTRDIEAHLFEVYGVTASQEMVSNITDVVADEIEIWRNRPVDEGYPIVYIDGIRIKVRDKGAVTIKTAHLVIGVDVDGRKHALTTTTSTTIPASGANSNRSSAWPVTASSRCTRTRTSGAAMDTYKEFQYLDELWQSGTAPWKIWR